MSLSKSLFGTKLYRKRGGSRNEMQSNIPLKHKKYMNHPYRHVLVIHENFDEIYPDAIEPIRREMEKGKEKSIQKCIQMSHTKIM